MENNWLATSIDRSPLEPASSVRSVHRDSSRKEGGGGRRRRQRNKDSAVDTTADLKAADPVEHEVDQFA